MLSRLTEPEHLIIIILVLLVSLLIAAGGKGLGELIGPIIKKLFSKGPEVTVNLGGDEVGRKPKECEQCGLIVDPAKCPLHSGEHERSLRNESGIKELGAELKGTRTQLFGKLDDMEKVLTEIKVAVAKLVVERNYQMDRRQREET